MNGEQHPWLDEYLPAKPGVTKDLKEEWGWLRYQVGSRLFAARTCPGTEHNPTYTGKDLLNLKCDPMFAGLLRREHTKILPGFYSNKRYWSSVDLGGGLPSELLRQLCGDSCRLVLEKLTKKLQKEILGENTK